MNGFENASVQELAKKQTEDFRNLEQRKHDDAAASPKDDLRSIPDVRERK